MNNKLLIYFFVACFTALERLANASSPPTAVYIGAAAAHRAEHDRKHHQQIVFGHHRRRQLQILPHATAALRERNDEENGAAHDHDFAVSASRTSNNLIMSGGDKSTASNVPLSLKLALANSKNLTNFFSQNVNAPNAQQREKLLDYAKATTVVQQKELARASAGALLASTRQSTAANKNRNYDHQAMMSLETPEDVLMVPGVEPVGCEPILQIVKLPISTANHTQIMQPDCVKVPRCASDCCLDKSLACRPVRTYTVATEVLLLEYVGGQSLEFVGSERVKLEAHEQCRCECRLLEADCSTRQIYDSTNCMCRCRNEADADRCQAPLVWNSRECRCACSESSFQDFLSAGNAV